MAFVVQSTGVALHFNGAGPPDPAAMTENINVDVYWHRLADPYQGAKLLGTFRVGAKVNFAVPVSEPAWVALRYVTRGGRGETDVADIRDAPVVIIYAPGMGGGGGGATRRDVRSHILNPVEDLAYSIPRDGSVDVGVKIQAAINQAIAERRELYFPPGTYRFAETLKLGSNFTDFKWTGAGRQLTVFQYTGEKNGVEAEDNATGYGVIFEKFRLEATNPNNYGSGFYFGHANIPLTNFQGVEVAAWNWRRFGFFASNMQSSTLRHWHFRNNRMCHIGIVDPSLGESVMEPNVNLLADSLLDNTVITGAGYQDQVASFTGMTEGRTGGMTITGGWTPAASDFGRVIIILDVVGDGGGQYYGPDRNAYGAIHMISGNRIETSAVAGGGDTPIYGAITASQTTINLNFDGFLFAETLPGKARIENEIVSYTSVANPAGPVAALTGVTRGVDGTTAAPHLDLTPIRQMKTVNGSVMAESLACVWARHANMFQMVNNTIQGNWQSNTANRTVSAVRLESCHGFYARNNWVENVPIDGSGTPQSGAGWLLVRMRGALLESSGSSANHASDVQMLDSHAIKFRGGFWGQVHHHFLADQYCDGISVDDCDLAAPQFVYGKDRSIDRIRVGAGVRYYFGAVSHFDYSATGLLPDELEDNLLVNGRFLFPIGALGGWLDAGVGGHAVVLEAGADGTRKFDSYVRINNRGGTANEASALIAQPVLFPAREAAEFVTLSFWFYVEELGTSPGVVVVGLEGTTAGGNYAGADASMRIENDGSFEVGVWRPASLTVKLAAAGSDRQLFAGFRSSNLSTAPIVRFTNLKLVRGRSSTGRWRQPLTSEAWGPIVNPSGLVMKATSAGVPAPPGCGSLIFDGTNWCVSVGGSTPSPIAGGGGWSDNTTTSKTTTALSVEPRPTSTSNVPMRVIGPAALATNVFEAWKGPPTGEAGGSAANRVYAVSNSGVMFLNQGNIRQRVRVLDPTDGFALDAADCFVSLATATGGPVTVYLPPTDNPGMQITLIFDAHVAGAQPIKVMPRPGEMWDGLYYASHPGMTFAPVVGILVAACVSDASYPTYVPQWRTIYAKTS